VCGCNILSLAFSWSSPSLENTIQTKQNKILATSHIISHLKLIVTTFLSSFDVVHGPQTATPDGNRNSQPPLGDGVTEVPFVGAAETSLQPGDLTT
jgi:hypothetical protein